ncbi:MAG: hypothetical protein ABI960_11200 [Candidatus Eisenbacteria bacterium]
MAKVFSLATYRVLPGKEAEFMTAWESLAATFAALPHAPYWGMLIRSLCREMTPGGYEVIRHVEVREEPKA